MANRLRPVAIRLRHVVIRLLLLMVTRLRPVATVTRHRPMVTRLLLLVVTRLILRMATRLILKCPLPVAAPLAVSVLVAAPRAVSQNRMKRLSQQLEDQ